VSVWAMVAHYGDPSLTRRAVTALLRGEASPDHVLVVDNGGDLPPLDMDGVETVRPARNVGFAGACRLGAERAVAAGARWVWLFNNDAVPDAGCLAALLAAGEAAPRAALLSPVIALRDGPGLWYAGGEVDPRSLSVTHARRPRLDRAHDTGFVTGCAWLARTDFVRDCGPPDEALFMYYEDVDWSLRAQAAGRRTLLVPAARVVHDVEFIHGRRAFSPLAVYYMTRNRLLLARQWGSAPYALGAALLWGSRQLLKCRSVSSCGAFAVAVGTGLRHGLAGRGGAASEGLARRLR
jgi:GT2 family glycosyltransferase